MLYSISPEGKVGTLTITDGTNTTVYEIRFIGSIPDTTAPTVESISFSDVDGVLTSGTITVDLGTATHDDGVVANFSEKVDVEFEAANETLDGMLGGFFPDGTGVKVYEVPSTPGLSFEAVEQYLGAEGKVGTLTITDEANNPTVYTIIFEGEVPDTTVPVLEEATLTTDENDNLVLTVKASDNEGLASLEVDHSLEGTLPEFTVGTEASITDPETGASSTFADGKWTLNFGPTVSETMRENDTITFYFVITDINGNKFGSMDPTTEDNTRLFDIPVSEEAEALAAAVDGTTMTGDLTDGITATFPTDVPAFFDGAGYKINSEIELDGNVDGIITITRGETDLVIEDGLNQGTYTYTELVQKANGGDEPSAADFDTSYAGKEENYAITVSGNTEAIDTTVTIRSIISDDEFSTREVLAELTGLELKVEAPDTTAPKITSITVNEGEEDQTGKTVEMSGDSTTFRITVEEENPYKLEVDIDEWEDEQGNRNYPSFSLYAESEDGVYGTAEEKTALNNAGITAEYDETNTTWKLTVSHAGLQAAEETYDIEAPYEFKFAAHDVAENNSYPKKVVTLSVPVDETALAGKYSVNKDYTFDEAAYRQMMQDAGHNESYINTMVAHNIFITENEIGKDLEVASQDGTDIVLSGSLQGYKDVPAYGAGPYYLAKMSVEVPSNLELEDGHRAGNYVVEDGKINYTSYYVEGEIKTVEVVWTDEVTITYSVDTSGVEFIPPVDETKI